MGQSLTCNYIHIVFSTKYRQNLITSDIEDRLYQYMGGICNSLNCNSIAIGGYKNHVHILCFLSKNISLSVLLQKIKSKSSKWVKDSFEDKNNFYWQNGYAAFSVSPQSVGSVKNYILNQHSHHEKNSFKDVLIQVLETNEVEYNEDYLWT